jgi:hypothetical protein
LNTYLDRHSLVKTKAEHSDASGDGVMHTGIGIFTGGLDGVDLVTPILKCFDNERCVLMRRPTNENGQQSHDGWMAFAIMLRKTKNVVLARGVLWSMFVRCFYMIHRPLELKGKTWKEKIKAIGEPLMLRFPRVIVMICAAAFPNRVVDLCASLFIRATLGGSSINVNDASGVQLKWQDRHGLRELGDPTPMWQFLKELQVRGTSMRKIMTDEGYWDADHWVLDNYDRYTTEVIG